METLKVDRDNISSMSDEDLTLIINEETGLIDRLPKDVRRVGEKRIAASPELSFHYADGGCRAAQFTVEQWTKFALSAVREPNYAYNLLHNRNAAFHDFCNLRDVLHGIKTFCPAISKEHFNSIKYLYHEEVWRAAMRTLKKAKYRESKGGYNSCSIFGLDDKPVREMNSNPAVPVLVCGIQTHAPRIGSKAEYNEPMDLVRLAKYGYCGRIPKPVRQKAEMAILGDPMESAEYIICESVSQDLRKDTWLKFAESAFSKHYTAVLLLERIKSNIVCYGDWTIEEYIDHIKSFKGIISRSQAAAMRRLYLPEHHWKMAVKSISKNADSMDNLVRMMGRAVK